MKNCWHMWTQTEAEELELNKLLPLLLTRLKQGESDNTLPDSKMSPSAQISGVWHKSLLLTRPSLIPPTYANTLQHIYINWPFCVRQPLPPFSHYFYGNQRWEAEPSAAASPPDPCHPTAACWQGWQQHKGNFKPRTKRFYWVFNKKERANPLISETAQAFRKGIMKTHRTNQLCHIHFSYGRILTSGA